MTFSLLAYDQETGVLGAAAATGSLCVGGWVLRGGLASGLVASQGTAPSSFWRDEILQRMGEGETAVAAIDGVTAADPGRDHRQVAALDLCGGAAGFTGAQSVAHAAHRVRPNLALAGNMLAGPVVLDALAGDFEATSGAMPDRLLAALKGAAAAGGDARGLMSAALLVLAPEAPALDLRIDVAEAPLEALESLLARARSDPYAGWLEVVPVKGDPHRAPTDLSKTAHSEPQSRMN